MNKRVLFGLRRFMLPIPALIWKRRIKDNADLGFMTQDHHRVRNFAVTALPRTGKPLPPEVISEALNLPLESVITILTDLEAHMTFLFRNPQGAVTWAYPVTIEPTPHRLSFSSGEQIYAA